MQATFSSAARLLPQEDSEQPLRILLVAINYAPDAIGCAKYNTELAEELARRGHQVEVVTGPPYYPAWKVTSGYSGAKWARETLHGVGITRTPMYVPRNPSGAKRIVHLASFAAMAALAVDRICKNFRPDVVMAVAPTLMAAQAAQSAARRHGAKSWLHVQDFEVEAAFDLGLLKNRTARKLALATERNLLLKFDRVSTISSAMVRKLIDKGVSPDRISELRNWADVDALQIFATTNTRYRQEHRIGSDETVALYSGNMGRKQGLEKLADVARQLLANGAPVRMLLCGDGPARSLLEQACAGLPNVSFLDLQPLERLPELLGTADVHLLPQRAEAADLVLPSKLGGMLASGRPIVAMAEPGTGLAEEVQGCGFAIPATAEAMTQMVLSLANAPALRMKLGVAGRMRAEQSWCKSAIIDEFELKLRSLTIDHARSAAQAR